MIEARDLPSSWDDAQIRLEIALRWARKEVAIGAAGLKKANAKASVPIRRGLGAPSRLLSCPSSVSKERRHA